MTGTKLHDVVNGLMTIFTGAGVAKLEVADGPTRTSKSNLMLEVAYAGPDRDAYEISRSQSNAGGVGGREDIRVWCMLSKHSGRGTATSVRAELTGAFAQLVSALEADLFLGGVASGPVAVTEMRGGPYQAEGANEATFLFAIDVIAFP